jgi:hypothetical protein
MTVLNRSVLTLAKQGRNKYPRGQEDYPKADAML